MEKNMYANASSVYERLRLAPHTTAASSYKPARFLLAVSWLVGRLVLASLWRERRCSS